MNLLMHFYDFRLNSYEYSSASQIVLIISLYNKTCVTLLFLYISIKPISNYLKNDCYSFVFLIDLKIKNMTNLWTINEDIFIKVRQYIQHVQTSCTVKLY